MSENAQRTVTERPSEPDLRAAQRVRLVLDFSEGEERVHQACEGWARIDGPWVLFIDDEFDAWQSWPMQHVVCIDWEEAIRDA